MDIFDTFVFEMSVTKFNYFLKSDFVWYSNFAYLNVLYLSMYVYIVLGMVLTERLSLCFKLTLWLPSAGVRI